LPRHSDTLCTTIRIHTAIEIAGNVTVYASSTASQTFHRSTRKDSKLWDSSTFLHPPPCSAIHLLFQSPIFNQVSIFGKVSVARRHLATGNRINIAALTAARRSSSLTVELATTRPCILTCQFSKVTEEDLVD